jgi:hypothetical protein
MKGFLTYFGVTNEIRRMSVGFLFHSSDRPERQFVTNTRKEGHFGKCSNYAYCVDFDRLQHARNATKISLPKFLPIISFQNLATATNVSARILIQTTPFNQVALSQRTTLWDQMK